MFIKKNQYIQGNQVIDNHQTVYGNIYADEHIVIAKSQTVKEDTFLNGDVFVGTTTLNTLRVNGITNFNNTTTLNTTSFTTSLPSFTANSSNIVLGGVLSNGSIVLGNTDSTNNSVNIYSKTVLSNTLSIQSDISTNGNIFSNIPNNRIYSDNFESISRYKNGFTNSIINVGNDSKNVNIGIRSTNINIGTIPNGEPQNIYIGYNGTSVTTVYGSLSVTGTLTASTTSVSPYLYVNTDSRTKDAKLSGMYIKEKYYFSQDNSGFVDAAFFITSNDRKRFKLKVPDCSNVCSLNLSQWVLPPTMQNGILVITNGNSTLNPDDTDICYNVNVSSYDISNILFRDKSKSTDSQQVVPSNLALLGNMSINLPATSTSVITSAMSISGSITQVNGWITQFY